MSAIKCCGCGAVSDSDGARLACGRCFDKAEAEVRRHEQRIKDYENEPGFREIVEARVAPLRAEVERLREAIRSMDASGSASARSVIARKALEEKSHE